MAKKTNKTHKLRGSREHGRGMKKGRGAGLRGGKGNAGWKHKKLHFLLYDQEHVRGARNVGFTRHAQDARPEPSLTVQHLDEQVAGWAALGKASRQDDGFTVDLGPMGFEKLVGTGQVRHALQVTVGRASEGAVRKIEAAGGRVTQTRPAPAARPAAEPGKPGPSPAPPPAGGKPKGGGGAKPAGGKPAKGGNEGGPPRGGAPR